jgi:hypothetical protein
MEDIIDVDDLPNSEKFWKSGETDWETPEEVDDEAEYKGSNRVGEMYGDND